MKTREKALITSLVTSLMLLMFFAMIQLVYSVTMMPTTVTYQVSYSNDDADEDGTGEFTYTSSRVHVHSYTDPSDYYYCCGGFRWRGVQVPEGAIIKSAIVYVYNYGGTYDNINCKVYGNDVGNAQSFSSLQYIISTSKRPRTSAYVSWVKIGMPIGWNSKDVTNIVQEIINRSDWNKGNALALLFIGNTDQYKKFHTFSYDSGSTDKTAKLEITYYTWMFPQDQHFDYMDTYWHENEFVPPDYPPPEETATYSMVGADGYWYGGCMDWSHYDWRTAMVEQGRMMGGYQYEFFLCDGSEIEATEEAYLEFDDWIGSGGNIFLEDEYFIYAKVKITERYAWDIWVDPTAFGEGVPATSVGIVLLWQVYSEDVGHWSDFDHAPDKLVFRGIWHDIFFDFATYTMAHGWVHKDVDTAWYHSMAKYDGDGHFCYVGGQITEMDTWKTVTIDLGKAINRMVQFMEYGYAMGWNPFYDKYRLRGIQVYCEAIGADFTVVIDYVDVYLL